LVLVLGARSLATAATIYVPAGGDLQGAIDSAHCGDEIVVQSGATFSGNFILRDRGTCSDSDADYIVIHPSNQSGISAPGARITPAYASQMVKLVSPNGTATVQTENAANHYKLIGLEITNVGGSVVTAELVLLDGPTHHITFDRVWVHEASNDTTTLDGTRTTATRGFDINAADITVTESRIAGFRAYLPAGSGDPSVQASNAILFPNRALRVRVINSYLEAWFAPVFFGGSGGNSPNTATLSNVSYDTGTHTGAATFSAVSNLSVGDLVALQVAGGHTPATNSAHPGEAVVYQVAKVTGISGSVVSFQAWGTFDGDINSGNPLLQAPCACGSQPLSDNRTTSEVQAQWNGYQNQDITIQRNQFVENFASTEAVWVLTGGSPTTLPRSTQIHTGNSPKGMIEIKMVKNLLVDGNTFEGWELGLVLTSRNQGSISTSGGFPWSGVFNVTISNNWWKRSANWDRIYGFPIGGPQLEDNEYSNVRSGPLTFANNLIESGTGPIMSSMGAANNVTVAHNTYPGAVDPDTSMVLGQGANSPNFVFKDNILSHNQYGMDCLSSQPCWPNLVETNNVIFDNRSQGVKLSDGPLNSRYPNDYIVADYAAVQWSNQAAGNYRLADSSPFKGHASDGTDPGVNTTALAAALGGSSATPTPTPTPTPSPSPTPTSTPDPIPITPPPVGSRVSPDIDGVFVRSGSSIVYGVVGTQGRLSVGTVDQTCVGDPLSPRVFCGVNFDAGVSGWLTVEHLVVVVQPSVLLVTADTTLSGLLVAVNAGRQTVESSISVTTPENFGADKRTRVMIFASGLSAIALNTDPANDVWREGVLIPNLAESVVVEVHTLDGRTINLPVEFAGAVGGMAGLDQINFVLVPELQGAGAVTLTVIVNGRRSNAPSIVIR
jgi:uncharacterized protein (TIGR03437 family)